MCSSFLHGGRPPVVGSSCEIGKITLQEVPEEPDLSGALNIDKKSFDVNLIDSINISKLGLYRVNCFTWKSICKMNKWMGFESRACAGEAGEGAVFTRAAGFYVRWSFSSSFVASGRLQVISAPVWLQVCIKKCIDFKTRCIKFQTPAERQQE